MFGGAEILRWDNPFPRTGGNLACSQIVSMVPSGNNTGNAMGKREEG